MDPHAPPYPALAVTASSAALVVQLVLAAMLPATTYWLLGRPKVRTVKWFDMLRLIGVLVVPTVLLLAMRGVVSPEVTAGVLGVTFGHVVTFVDTD